jgi:hypothetical protein
VKKRYIANKDDEEKGMLQRSVGVFSMDRKGRKRKGEERKGAVTGINHKCIL